MARPDWFDERDEQILDALSTFDHATFPELNPMWEGVYKVRLLPPESPDMHLVQAGRHINVFPPDEGMVYREEGCPRFTFGKDCPVCDAVSKAYAERKITTEELKDLQNKGRGLWTNEKHLLRVVLVGFEPKATQKSKVKVPKFTTPCVKVMRLPARGVGKKIQAILKSEDYGWDALMDPKKGCVLRLTKDSSLVGHWEVAVLREQEIPDELLDVSKWPDPHDYQPQTTTEDLRALIEIYQHDIHPVIANFSLALDVESRALPPGGKRKNLREKLAEMG